jgi:hypothetical protein
MNILNTLNNAKNASLTDTEIQILLQRYVDLLDIINSDLLSDNGKILKLSLLSIEFNTLDKAILGQTLRFVHFPESSVNIRENVKGFIDLT